MIRRLSKSQIEAQIRAVAADSRRVAFTRHAPARMQQRQITREMVVEILRKGRLLKTLEPNPAKGSLECRMERFVAGRNLAVVVAVSHEFPDLVVVTAMALE